MFTINESILNGLERTSNLSHIIIGIHRRIWRLISKLENMFEYMLIERKFSKYCSVLVYCCGTIELKYCFVSIKFNSRSIVIVIVIERLA